MNFNKRNMTVPTPMYNHLAFTRPYKQSTTYLLSNRRLHRLKLNFSPHIPFAFQTEHSLRYNRVLLLFLTLLIPVPSFRSGLKKRLRFTIYITRKSKKSRSVFFLRFQNRRVIFRLL